MKKYLPSAVKFLTIMLGMWLLTSALVTVTKSKFNDLKISRAEIASRQVVTADERARQLRCLTQNIYWEAASEPFEGKVAVAQVTINRAEARGFPDDICQVIYQKNVNYERVICQFSWYCDRESTSRIINKSVYNESMEVAKKVLLEGFRLPSLTSALYYHADYVRPGWKKERITQIGRHIFYK